MATSENLSQGDQPSLSAKEHISVMPAEIAEYLNLQPGATVVDCTLGLGGHARSIIQTIGPKGLFIGIDRDASALETASEKLKDYAHQSHLVQGDFRNIDTILQELNITGIDGCLMDLGISSFQLDNPGRGFSLKADGPLDMRMDQNAYISAYDLVNTLSEKEISDILRDFGQERWHHRIARNVIAQRDVHPIETTRELRKLVMRSLPMNRRREKTHPATRTFQALRIAVNRELEALDVGLQKAIQLLNPGGRICVISFHSLEDGIVKRAFRAASKEQQLELIVKKPLRPSEAEAQQNPRARSARLRVGQKTP